MYIRSRYMDAVEEIKAELTRIAEEVRKTAEAIEVDEILTGDWTDNECAIAHDDLMQDLRVIELAIDIAAADLADIIEREKVRT